VTEAPRVTTTPAEVQEPGWKVVVYDNDYNTYLQVMTILMIATGCSEEEAWMEAWEIDHLGRSDVHHGAQEECERVAKVVSTIGIRVEAIPE
jgi:ATP-dependent Clp protease adapter protein ClpS